MVVTHRGHDTGGPAYEAWRATVKARDHNRCLDCGATADLEAHHIVPWARSAALRFEPLNGVTLCAPCHRAVHRMIRAARAKRERTVLADPVYWHTRIANQGDKTT